MPVRYSDLLRERRLEQATLQIRIAEWKSGKLKDVDGLINALVKENDLLYSRINTLSEIVRKRDKLLDDLKTAIANLMEWEGEQSGST